MEGADKRFVIPVYQRNYDWKTENCKQLYDDLVKIIKDLDGDLSGKDVLIVEDILDTGVTLSNLVPMLKMRNPNSVKICTILDKPSRRKADIQPDYEGFQVPDEFVVGYGLDYDEKYRNLPYVGVLKPEVYTK